MKIENAVILVDTRQKEDKHKMKHEYLTERGFILRRCKLYVGDYALANNQSRVVDTKQSVLELISDVHEQHYRFSRELQKAQEAGIQLLVLVEEKLPERGLIDWVSPKRSGRPITITSMISFRKALVTMSKKYGALFRFYAPEESGRIIEEFLMGSDEV